MHVSFRHQLFMRHHVVGSIEIKDNNDSQPLCITTNETTDALYITILIPGIFDQSNKIRINHFLLDCYEHMLFHMQEIDDEVLRQHMLDMTLEYVSYQLKDGH